MHALDLPAFYLEGSTPCNRGVGLPNILVEGLEQGKRANEDRK